MDVAKSKTVKAAFILSLQSGAFDIYDASGICPVASTVDGGVARYADREVTGSSSPSPSFVAATAMKCVS
jgi:hypothetical protein